MLFNTSFLVLSLLQISHTLQLRANSLQEPVSEVGIHISPNQIFYLMWVLEVDDVCNKEKWVRGFFFYSRLQHFIFKQLQSKDERNKNKASLHILFFCLCFCAISVSIHLYLPFIMSYREMAEKKYLEHAVFWRTQTTQ